NTVLRKGPYLCFFLINISSFIVNSDIVVKCGTQFMELSILYCPIYHANYNGDLMILNGQTIPECKGVVDSTVNPPVLRFKLSIDQQSLRACNNIFRIINSAGSGDLADFSNVQYVNVSGIVVSHDPASGLITYRPSITYLYSCEYPLQYVLNNTALAVSGVSIAINDNNGSFISTLAMRLFTVRTVSSLVLNVPSTGLNLKQRIYVEVTASNLTNSFHVLLDRCFASTEQYADCESDEQTRLHENGESQRGRFSFEAFRFLIHANLTVSTFYIHCITRLCNQSMCASMLPVSPNLKNPTGIIRDNSQLQRVIITLSVL
uniref:Si:dkey-4p15.5 n=1 Tax=Neogobius melanostomus TaxID=47308 RepID=A0A8C6SRX0_9GOBI